MPTSNVDAGARHGYAFGDRHFPGTGCADVWERSVRYYQSAKDKAVRQAIDDLPNPLGFLVSTSIAHHLVELGSRQSSRFGFRTGSSLTSSLTVELGNRQSSLFDAAGNATVANAIEHVERLLLQHPELAAHGDAYRRAVAQRAALRDVVQTVNDAHIARPSLTCWPNGRILMRWQNKNGGELCVDNNPWLAHYLENGLEAPPKRGPVDVKEAERINRRFRSSVNAHDMEALHRWDRWPDENAGVPAPASLVEEAQKELATWEPLPYLGHSTFQRRLSKVVRQFTGNYHRDAWFVTEHSRRVGPWTLTVRDDLDETASVWTVSHQETGEVARGRARTRSGAQRDAQIVQERIAGLLTQPGVSYPHRADDIRLAAWSTQLAGRTGE